MGKLMTTLDVNDDAGKWLVEEAMRKRTDIATVVKELIYAEMARRGLPVRADPSRIEG